MPNALLSSFLPPSPGITPVPGKRLSRSNPCLHFFSLSTGWRIRFSPQLSIQGLCNNHTGPWIENLGTTWCVTLYVSFASCKVDLPHFAHSPLSPDDVKPFRWRSNSGIGHIPGYHRIIYGCLPNGCQKSLFAKWRLHVWEPMPHWPAVRTVFWSWINSQSSAFKSPGFSQILMVQNYKKPEKHPRFKIILQVLDSQILVLAFDSALLYFGVRATPFSCLEWPSPSPPLPLCLSVMCHDSLARTRWRLASVHPSVKVARWQTVIPSLDCAPAPSTLAQSKKRKGSNFAA